MIWHIVRKDVRLLWGLALGVAVIHLAAAASLWRAGPLQEPSQLVTVAAMLSVASLIGIAVLTLSVMHQDAVPDASQDWLIRPIRRIDLIAAKLLCVAVVVQVPWLLVDLGEGLASGFTIGQSLSAAAAANLTILCFLTLPSVAIGAVTRNLMQAFVFAVGCLVLYTAVLLVGLVLLLGVKTTLGGTGLAWMWGAAWLILAVVGTALVMGIQFFRRRTVLARYLLGAGGALVVLAAFVPWRAAFSLQTALSSAPGLAGDIAVALDPKAAPFALPPGAVAASGVALHVPLTVAGIPAGAMVLLDRADVRLTDSSGRTLYAGKSSLSVDGVGSIEEARLIVRQAGRGSASVEAYQQIFLPAAVYGRLRGKVLTMSIEEFLTLYRPDPAVSLPAIDGRARLAGLGLCRTAVDGDGDEVRLRCLEAGRTPACFTAFLDDAPHGLRNPETRVCEPDYAPLAIRLWPDALGRFGGNLPFFDPRGLSRYPIDGTRVAQARLVIETYRPGAHFTRNVSISGVRLADLAGALATIGRSR